MAEEIIIRCPVCGDKESHFHCSINFEKKLYHCYLCGVGGSLAWLISKYPHIRQTLVFAGYVDHESVRKHVDGVMETFSVLSDLVLARQARMYLKRRGLSEEEIETYGCCLSMSLPGYVIFPDIEGGIAKFWVARHLGTHPRKWLLPKNGTVTLKRSQAVWGLALQQKDSEIWICEGIFDAAAVRGVALFGKEAAPGQLQVILALNPKRVVVALDNDAKSYSLALQKQLRAVVETHIEYPPHGVNDFGELLVHGWRRVVKEEEIL